MASLLSFVNRLLPFATPGTPLVQDLIHLAVICTALYFAPQIQEWLQRTQEQHDEDGSAPPDTPNAEHAVNEEAQAEEDRNQEEGVFEQEAHDHAPDAPPHNADFRGFQQEQNPNLEDEEGVAGPAHTANIPAQRNVGAKKAKSLARKDQRRAYHEFQRVQGDVKRAKDAEGAAEREAAQAAERERRRALEAQLDAKKAKEREAKREQERKEREGDLRRRELAVGIVRRELDETGMSNLVEVAGRVGGETDEVWVEKMVVASDLLGKNAKDGTLTFLTTTGWIARVRREDMGMLYEIAAEISVGHEDGKIGFVEVGKQLEAILRKGR